MGIDVAWTDEQSLILKEVHDPGGLISRLATYRWLALSDSKCLQFIEPWGDTKFNQTQIPVLMAELQAQVATVDNPREAAQLQEVINLVSNAINQVHTYIVFTGD